MTDDPFQRFKAAQREAWSAFAPLETVTIPAAAKLVKFAEVKAGQSLLDVACGTGVVAVTAARRGAGVSGLDLAPPLLERARQNAAIAGVEVDFVEGDAEALAYADASFDVVLSQFGHMFTPRPAMVIGEMLRVLKPGGRIAFSTFPPEFFTARQFDLFARYSPPPAPGSQTPASPALWGDPNIIRERLGERVTDLRFDRDAIILQTLSVPHARLFYEATLGPLTKLVVALRDDPARLARLRAEFEAMLEEMFDENVLRLYYIMTRATKTR